MLVNYFIEEAAVSLDKKPPKASDELLILLENYHFPGNVRELRSMVFDAVARHKSGPILSAKKFRKAVKAQKSVEFPSASAKTKTKSSGHFLSLKEAERLHIEEAMRRSNGNQGVAAALLGISRPALNRRLSRMGDEEKG